MNRDRFFSTDISRMRSMTDTELKDVVSFSHAVERYYRTGDTIKNIGKELASLVDEIYGATPSGASRSVIKKMSVELANSAIQQHLETGAELDSYLSESAIGIRLSAEFELRHRLGNYPNAGPEDSIAGAASNYNGIEFDDGTFPEYSLPQARHDYARSIAVETPAGTQRVNPSAHYDYSGTQTSGSGWVAGTGVGPYDGPYYGGAPTSVGVVATSGPGYVAGTGVGPYDGPFVGGAPSSLTAPVVLSYGVPSVSLSSLSIGYQIGVTAPISSPASAPVHVHRPFRVPISDVSFRADGYVDRWYGGHTGPGSAYSKDFLDHYGTVSADGAARASIGGHLRAFADLLGFDGNVGIQGAYSRPGEGATAQSPMGYGPSAPATSPRPMPRPDNLTGGSSGGSSGRWSDPSQRGDDVDPHDPHGAKNHPILIDLNGNGIELTELSESSRFVDSGNEGLLHRTAWAGVGDGCRSRSRDRRRWSSCPGGCAGL